MEITWLLLIHFVFVPLLYRVAYKNGYSACYSENASRFQDLTAPITEMFDNLDKTIDHLVEKQKQNPNTGGDSERERS